MQVWKCVVPMQIVICCVNSVLYFLSAKQSESFNFFLRDHLAGDVNSLLVVGGICRYFNRK